MGCYCAQGQNLVFPHAACHFHTRFCLSICLTPIFKSVHQSAGSTVQLSIHLSIHLSALLLNHQQNEKHSISSPHGSMDGFKDGGQTGEWTEPWVKWQVCAKHLLGQGEVGWCRRDKLSETMLGKMGISWGCFRLSQGCDSPLWDHGNVLSACRGKVR